MTTAQVSVIRLNASDDVAIACKEIGAGMRLDEYGLVAQNDISPGHKIALRDIPEGQAIRRYSQIIGFASRLILAGEHVHVHNLKVEAFQRDYAFCADVRATTYAHPNATFRGIVRPDGRVA